jgi:hypothetical protein
VPTIHIDGLQMVGTPNGKRVRAARLGFAHPTKLAKQKRRPELGGVLNRSAEVVENEPTSTLQQFQFL